MRRTRSESTASSFSAMSGLRRISRSMSGPSSATAAVSSIASAVAERVSWRNIASSPNMSPARSSDSAIVRPSWWSRVSTTAPLRIRKQVSPGSPSRKMHLAAIPVARDRHLGDRAQLALLETPEDLGARQ